MKTIKEIALEKKKEYGEKYTQWCKENPGYIMNGLNSMTIGAEFAQYCNTRKELETLHKIYLAKANNTKHVHGFFFMSTAFNEILQEFINQKSIN